MIAERADVCVIGAGLAEVVAAMRAARLGARTTLVTRDAVGGMAAADGPVPDWPAGAAPSRLHGPARAGPGRLANADPHGPYRGHDSPHKVGRNRAHRANADSRRPYRGHDSPHKSGQSRSARAPPACPAQRRPHPHRRRPRRLQKPG